MKLEQKLRSIFECNLEKINKRKCWSSFHFSIWFTDRTTDQPTVPTTHASVTLTTMILPSVKPDYEKLPTNEPVSSLNEKTTTSTTIAPNTEDTNSTITYNRTTFVQSSTVSPIAEISEKLTTISKIGMRCHLWF